MMKTKIDWCDSTLNREVIGMYWHISYRADRSVLPLADRHYSRKTPGSPQFVPPGRCVVLKTANCDALWITSWQYPEYTAHEFKGAWVCCLFRNESAILSSRLILMAVSAVRFFWTPPTNGIITFVNPKKIQSPNPGYCFKKAGFFKVGETKRGLIVLQMLPEAMPGPLAPLGIQKSLSFKEE